MTVVDVDAGSDLSKFVDQRVVIKVRREGGVQESAGTLLAAADIGVMFKPRGRTQGEIIELDKVISIDYAPAKPKALKAKKLKDIVFGQARQHLADRHGTVLSVLVKVDEQAAMTLHENIDHTDLGHYHESDAARSQAAAGPIATDNPDGADPQDEDDEDSEEYTDDEDEKD